MMLINNQGDAETHMNILGKERIPFVFLIDYEMKKIIIETNIGSESILKYDINGITNCKPSYNKELHKGYFTGIPMDYRVYQEGFDLVKKEIQNGNSFLLNLTYRTQIETGYTLAEIYNQTQAKYKIFLEDDFVCFSPEIFVRIKDGIISSYPMKGTIDASIPDAADVILNDSKESAEHYTIVDLIRNDLSRIAKKVTVNRFRYIDTIVTSGKTLLQVSSEITGVLPIDYSDRIGQLIFRLLPAGSISGAPKIKTVDIIRQAEQIDRGYYTGICGYFDGTDLDSGVMIRYVEKNGNTLYYRSGCGITSMSDSLSEYKEMIDKVYLPNGSKK